MGVDAKTRQRQLWDILGKPEKKQFAFDPILTGKRIGAGRGEYWYGRGGAAGNDNGRDDGGTDSQDGEGGQNGKNGDGNQSNNVDDPRRDPAKGCPKPGDSVPGLKNMRDCATGRCVNVDFTLPARPPQGWEEACTPAPDTRGWKKGTYYLAGYRKAYFDGMGNVYRREEGEKEFHTDAAAREWLKGFLPETHRHMLTAMQDVINFPGGSIFFSIQPEASEDPQWQIPPDSTWPQDACAEIVSTATGFTPACEEHDPNLPPQLKGDNSAIRLCDADGNEITIRRNGKGWVYETATCTVTVNNGGVVDNVRDKAP